MSMVNTPSRTGKKKTAKNKRSAPLSSHVNKVILQRAKRVTDENGEMTFKGDNHLHQIHQPTAKNTTDQSISPNFNKSTSDGLINMITSKFINWKECISMMSEVTTEASGNKG